MNRLRNRVILVFLAATLGPLAATLWITVSLLQRSLSYATTAELDTVSRSLETTAREYYRQARERLRHDVAEGRIQPVPIAAPWPEPVRDFWESGSTERFYLTGDRGNVLNYVVRSQSGPQVYALDLGPVGMTAISSQYRQARGTVDSLRGRDLRRGFLYTFVVLSAAVWVAGLAALVVFAVRISRPIHQLTNGLRQLAEGNLEIRLPEGDRSDEVGRAIHAFNDTASQLRESRDRLVYLAQLASWQSLARKMAHEVKNALTPIRLNMEEIVARGGDNDPQFIAQAAQIVSDEVNSLERRVRAFSDFASEPPVRPSVVDLNAVVEERVAFLRRGHPEVEYRLSPAGRAVRAAVDEDLLRGILTNLLENAADAAGVVLVKTDAAGGHAVVEVHDSGPGLSDQARATLFEPTISFKRGGMGLGLSIARKSALLCGGDITLAEGELGGAAFRVRLPEAPAVARRVPA